MKTGDVIVMDEAALQDLLGKDHIFSDVRQGKAHMKKTIEEAEEDPGVQLVLRVEKVGRARARKPAFDCAFDGDED